jgi:hypothetical protein
MGTLCSPRYLQLTQYFLNALESSKGEESSVSISINKKLIFGCEHFVPRFGPTRSKTNIRYNLFVFMIVIERGGSAAAHRQSKNHE